MKLLSRTRVDGRIMTYSGHMIDPLNPDPELIALEDIAHALSNCTRFTGHTSRFYSIAQHSVLVSQIVSPRYALCGLMHDASEAYLSDIASPVKRQPEFRRFYEDVEARLMAAISMRFGFAWPMPDEVHEADTILLRSEQRDLMPPSPDLILYRECGGAFLQTVILPWAPDIAKAEFLQRWYDLTDAA